MRHHEAVQNAIPVDPSPAAAGAAGESLSEQYARLALDTGPRGTDLALRALDLALGGTIITAASLPIAAIGAAIRLTSGPPVLYRGRRVGRAGQPFTMLKFRTLIPDAETRLGPYLGNELTKLTEEEVTPVGRILRATQLDELPQLINVLRGEMSLVGPRPIRPAFFEELCAEIPQYWQRLVVSPGMTGFAQMRMSREMSWAEKLSHDLEWIADRSPDLYLEVVARTLRRITRNPRAHMRARRAGMGPGVGAGRS
jgi:lipopolysaccharide/colanic/teichoic acid biosynthesis glycosyltransferase